MRATGQNLTILTRRHGVLPEPGHKHNRCKTHKSMILFDLLPTDVIQIIQKNARWDCTLGKYFNGCGKLTINISPSLCYYFHINWNLFGTFSPLKFIQFKWSNRKKPMWDGVQGLIKIYITQ